MLNVNEFLVLYLVLCELFYEIFTESVGIAHKLQRTREVPNAFIIKQADSIAVVELRALFREVNFYHPMVISSVFKSKCFLLSLLLLTNFLQL